MRSEQKHDIASDVVAFPRTRGSKLETPGTHQTLLDTVLNNMSHAVLLFDGRGRLAFFNERYIAMYGLSPEVVVRGCSLDDLLRHRAAVGSFSGDPEKYKIELLRDIRSGKTSSTIVRVPDGRIFCVISKPLGEGGWIATHEDITDRQLAEERIVHMARHDALTDLPNRTMLRERLEYELKRAKRGEGLAVFCLDLDNFKSVNDTLGHPIGDAMLKVVADRLRSCIRDSDTIARLGGDEFAIIMTAVEDPRAAATLAKRIRESITRPYNLDGHQVLTDISIGISIAPADAVEPDLLLKNADMALYGAKADGRGTYRFFEPEMDARMKARRELEMDLRNALLNAEFELHYQPLVNLQSNAITGFEALLRWNHPVRGLVSPGEFVPIAEETGCIIPLGEWVLRRACHEAVNWPANIKVAVNLSPLQLKNKNFVDLVVNVLANSGLPADRLQLEITETVMMQNTFNTLATLQKLRGLGVQIALDDFGTGYSSLSYLRSFPFDKIKIDRSFVQDLSTSREPIAIVHAVAGLAKSLNMVSTAEGVETQEQRDALQSLGCVEMQGYLFSRPRPADQLAEVLVQSQRSIDPCSFELSSDDRVDQ